MTDTAPSKRAFSQWPPLRLDEWTASRDTLHMWTQIVGKIRLVHAPMVNHWWQVTLYVSPRGLTTSAIPYGAGVFDVEFDFVEHKLHIRSSDGGARQVALEPKSVADFYVETMRTLDELAIPVQIRATPNEVDPAIYAQAPRRNWIDDLVLEKLRELHLPPSPRSSDSEFIRRAFLDTIGVLPTAARANPGTLSSK